MSQGEREPGAEQRGQQALAGSGTAGQDSDGSGRPMQPDDGRARRVAHQIGQRVGVEPSKKACMAWASTPDSRQAPSSAQGGSRQSISGPCSSSSRTRSPSR